MFEPYRLVDGGGQPVVAVAGFLRSLQAAGRSEATQRSYGMDLLRWFRFTWAAGFAWDQADAGRRPGTSAGGCSWRASRSGMTGGRDARRGPGSGPPAAGTVNAVTGKASPGPGYAAATVAHCATVCRSFYDHHLEVGSGRLAQPVPAGQEGRIDGQADAANKRIADALGGEDNQDEEEEESG